jgi:hypothetical protein
MHWQNGATPEMNIFATQIPRGTSIMFATRYPSWTSLTIEKVHRFFGSKYQRLNQVTGRPAALDRCWQDDAC